MLSQHRYGSDGYQVVALAISGYEFEGFDVILVGPLGFHGVKNLLTMDVLEKLFEQHFHAPADASAAAAGRTGRLGAEHHPALPAKGERDWHFV